MASLRNLPVTPLSPFFVFEQFADRQPLIVVAASLAMGGVATDRVEQRFPFAAVPYFTKYCLRSDGTCRSEAMKAVGQPIRRFSVVKHDERRKLVAASHVARVIFYRFEVHTGAWLQVRIGRDVGKLDFLLFGHFSP